MAIAKKRRSLLAYAIHGHDQSGPIDYAQLLEFISSLPYEIRRLRTGDRTTVISEIQRASEAVFVMRIVTGFPEEDQTMFDALTGDERSIAKRDSEFAPTSGIVAVNVVTRAVVLEKKRPGVPISLIERLLSTLGRELFGNRFSVSLTPVISDTFLAEIEGFERIRRAEVQLARPNFDWRTEAEDLLSSLGDSSNAATIEVAASAKRGDSLASDQGIVSDIKGFAKRKINALKNAKIIGTRSGSSGDTTLSLDKHQQRREVTFNGSEEDADNQAMIRDNAVAFADQLSLIDQNDHDG